MIRKNTRRYKTEQREKYKNYLRKKGQMDKDGVIEFEKEKEQTNHVINNFFTKGIYKLYFNGKVVYVGMSTNNCMNRVNNHWNDNKKIFDSFDINPLPNLSNKQLAKKEKSLIKKYKPVFNIVHNQNV